MAAVDTRRNVAVHEAGHVVAARTYRARGVTATLRTDARGRSRGLTKLRSWRGSDLEFVVYTLAGAAAGRLITGAEALCDSDDLSVARHVLAQIGGTYRDADRRAMALVRRHHPAIEQVAERAVRARPHLTRRTRAPSPICSDTTPRSRRSTP
jgi:hypothetical protein